MGAHKPWPFLVFFYCVILLKILLLVQFKYLLLNFNVKCNPNLDKVHSALYFGVTLTARMSTTVEKNAKRRHFLAIIQYYIMRLIF